MCNFTAVSVQGVSCLSSSVCWLSYQHAMRLFAMMEAPHSDPKGLFKPHTEIPSDCFVASLCSVDLNLIQIYQRDAVSDDNTKDDCFDLLLGLCIGQ